MGFRIRMWLVSPSPCVILVYTYFLFSFEFFLVNMVDKLQKKCIYYKFFCSSIVCENKIVLKQKYTKVSQNTMKNITINRQNRLNKINKIPQSNLNKNYAINYWCFSTLPSSTCLNSSVISCKKSLIKMKIHPKKNQSIIKKCLRANLE